MPARSRASFGKKPVISHVVNREDHGNISHRRVVSVGTAQEYGHECGLPIVAMKHVRGPNVLSNFDCRPAEFAVAFRVVGKISRAIAVETVAIEICRIIYKEIPDAANYRAIQDCGKTQLARHRNRKAGQYHGSRFCATVMWQKRLLLRGPAPRVLSAAPRPRPRGRRSLKTAALPMLQKEFSL